MLVRPAQHSDHVLRYVVLERTCDNLVICLTCARKVGVVACETFGVRKQPNNFDTTFLRTRVDEAIGLRQNGASVHS